MAFKCRYMLPTAAAYGGHCQTLLPVREIEACVLIILKESNWFPTS